MRSKRNTQSQGLRRTKSCLSTRSHQRTSAELTARETPSATAANLQAVAAGRQALCGGSPARQPSARPSPKRSVRYFGPNANTPLLSKSITRRCAPGYQPASEFGLAGRPGSRNSTWQHQQVKSMLTALPQMPPQKPEQCRNKLRKTRSLRASSSQQSILSLPHSSEQVWRAASPSRASSPSQDRMFYSSHDFGLLPRGENEVQNLLTAHSLKPKNSLQTFMDTCKREFSLRKVAKPSLPANKPIVIPSVASEPNSNIVPSLRVRKRLTSLKKGVQNILHLRTPSSATRQSLPTQHIQASREHFTKTYDTDEDGEEEEQHYPVIEPGTAGEDTENVWREEAGLMDDEQGYKAVGSYLVKSRTLPGLQRKSSQGTVVLGKAYSSRATSWTDSSVGSDVAHMPVVQAEKKRLSVIEENGGPYQPSTSKTYSPFQTPVPRTVSGNTAGPVDSHRVYSALQRHINREKNAFVNPWAKDTKNDSSGTSASASYASILNRSPMQDASIRMVSHNSSTSQQNPSAAASAHSLHGQMSIASSWTDDNVFSAKAPASENVSNPREPPPNFRVRSGRGPREARSTFFPASSGLRPRGSSPAVLSQGAHSKSGFVGLGAERRSGSLDKVDSTSVYSRDTDDASRPVSAQNSVHRHEVIRNCSSINRITEYGVQKGSTALEGELEASLMQNNNMRHWVLSVPNTPQKPQQNLGDLGRYRNTLAPPKSLHKREKAIICSGSSVATALDSSREWSTEPRPANSCSLSRQQSFGRRVSDQQNSHMSHVYPYLERNPSTASINSRAPKSSSSIRIVTDDHRAPTNIRYVEDIPHNISSYPTQTTDTAHLPSWIPSRQASIRLIKPAGAASGIYQPPPRPESARGSARGSTRSSPRGSCPATPDNYKRPAASYYGSSRHSPIRVERLRRAHDSSPRDKGPTRVSPPRERLPQWQRQAPERGVGGMASGENAPCRARAPYAGVENPWSAPRSLGLKTLEQERDAGYRDEGECGSGRIAGDEGARVLRERVTSNGSIAFL